MAQDGEFGDGVARCLRVVAVVVEAEGCREGEGGVGGEDGTDEGEADGGWVDGFCGTGRVVGGGGFVVVWV